MKKIMVVLSIVLSVGVLSACSGTEDNREVRVVTTLFPQYDMVRSLAGDKVDLSLTLPPGVSAHTYEPTPSTVIDLLNADLLIYSSDMLEPWVEDFLAANDVGDLRVMNLSEFVILLEEDHGDEEEEEEDDHDHGDADPHYWADPLNAKLMLNAIALELERLLEDDVDFIRENKEVYLEELDHLHEEFLHLKEERAIDILMHGGHNAIGYFIERYDIEYVNPYEGFSTDAEPTPARIANMIDVMNEFNIGYLFSETLLSQTVANTIVEQTGAEILYIYSGGNLSKSEFDDGLTFLEMMEHNLIQYRIGLGYDETDHAH
ncbi:MAG: metal ABC transporter substrate-binding protein [Candidatus Izemoplasmataceae bacterium]